MADRDVNVLLKKQQDDQTNSMYPVTKVGNILIDSKTTLDKWITEQKKYNLTYDIGMNKLETIEEGAQVNQNAFSIIRVGNQTLSSVLKKDTLTLESDSNIIISIENGKLRFELGDQSIEDVNDKESGLMTPALFKKLNGIEENANRYVHPSSGVTAGTYIRVKVDERGHITSGDNLPIPISQGGTGANNLEDARTNLGIVDPLNVVDEVNANITDPISSKGVYNALQNKANKEHGNHVPDSTGTTTKYLQDGNVWAELTAGTVNNSGIVKLSTTYNASDSSTAATPSLVAKAYDRAAEYADSLITNIINGADANLDTLGEIGDWISEHGDVYDALVTTVGNKVDKVTGKGLSELDFTTEINNLINELAEWITDHYDIDRTSQENIIESVSVNGEDIRPVNKNVNISIPTQISAFENDSAYLTEHPEVTLTSTTTSSETLDNGDSFTFINGITKDSYGHVTKNTTKTITLPSTAPSPGELKFGVANDGEAGEFLDYNYDGTSPAEVIISGEDDIRVSRSAMAQTNGKLRQIRYSIESTLGDVTTTTSGKMTPTLLTKLNGIAANANNYSLPTASSTTLGGVKTTSTVTDSTGYIATPIISGVPYFKNTTYSNGNGLLLSNGVFSHAETGTGSALTLGDTGGDRDLAFGDTFTALKTTIDKFGHINALQKVTLKLPANPNTDKSVETVPNAQVKAYLTGTMEPAKATGNLQFDTGVYLTTTAGQLHATSFDGNLTGTAAKATSDSNGNKITDTYRPNTDRGYVVSSTQPSAGKGDILWAQIVAE